MIWCPACKTVVEFPLWARLDRVLTCLCRRLLAERDDTRTLARFSFSSRPPVGDGSYESDIIGLDDGGSLSFFADNEREKRVADRDVGSVVARMIRDAMVSYVMES
jgi:hypothetical protein